MMDLEKEYEHVIHALDAIETKLRVQKIPSLLERAPPLEADDLKEQELKRRKVDLNIIPSDDALGDDGDNRRDDVAMVMADIEEDGTSASLRRRNLKTFSLSMIPLPIKDSLSLDRLIMLDVSQNELMDLPGLGTSMPNLKVLNLERNWFNTLPTEIGMLSQLTTLLAARNFLRPNATSLLFPQLKQLKHLKLLDLQYNQKCGRPHHRDLIRNEIQHDNDNCNNNLEIKMTLWEEVGNVEGSYVGKSAAERNPQILRSQLEPLGTVALRRRLVQDFGQIPTDPSIVDRAGVMHRLLKCYHDEGLMTVQNKSIDEINEGHSTPSSKDLQNGIANRTRVYLDGVPVSQNMIDDLLLELRAWTAETGGKNVKNRERPSIHADNYMILRSPKLLDEEQQKQQQGITTNTNTRASRRAMRKAKKLEKYKKIWELAQAALKEVDPEFSDRCTEIAVTFGFQGSPHRDKQNCGPFYGFSLGNFPDGQGGICVECSARLIAVMNTKNRLGRVDGRYPHWVDQYDHETSERYSLIYYETGNDFVKPGPAVFEIPRTVI